MNRDTKDIINHGTSTFMNIAQMTQSRIKYAQQGNAEDKEKSYKYAFLAGVGIVSLLAIGIVGLIESRNNY